MSSIQVETRKDLATILESKRVGGEFLFNGFAVEETWLPREEYKTLQRDYPEGKVYLCCKAISEGPNRTRNTPLMTREYEIFVGYQRAGVTTNDLDSIDQQIDFVDQLYAVCRELPNLVVNSEYQFVRNEAMIDENGVAYDFLALQGHNLLGVYFSAVYMTTIAGGLTSGNP